MSDNTRDFETLVTPHYPRLVRRLTMIVRDVEEGKDLAQATLLRAFESWSSVDRNDVGPWLMTIGTRLALNEIRRTKRTALWPAARDSVVFDRHSDDELWQALGDLRREERAALLLATLGGYTYAEVASHLDVPPGTAAAWISRAKDHLRSRLGEEPFRDH